MLRRNGNSSNGVAILAKGGVCKNARGEMTSGKENRGLMQLDRLDVAILDYLQMHGRATAAELGEAVSLSPSPSHRRQKLLEEAGVIQRYVALLDQDKAGLPISVFVSVKMANHAADTLRGFERAVEACPEVMEMYEMSGSTDYLLRVVAADVASYEAFLRGTLTHIPGVQSFESAMALKRIVYRTNLPVRSARRDRG